MPAAPGPPSALAAAVGAEGRPLRGPRAPRSWGRSAPAPATPSPSGASALPRPAESSHKLSHFAGGERLPAKCEQGGSHPVRDITPVTSPLLPSQPFSLLPLSLLPPSSAAFPRKLYQCGHAAVRRFACSKHECVPEEVAWWL